MLCCLAVGFCGRVHPTPHSGDACVKWTDKWAERLLPGGAREQWGDKWHEAFANGRGEKNGEVRGVKLCEEWLEAVPGAVMHFAMCSAGSQPKAWQHSLSSTCVFVC